MVSAAKRDVARTAGRALLLVAAILAVGACQLAGTRPTGSHVSTPAPERAAGTQGTAPEPDAGGTLRYALGEPSAIVPPKADDEHAKVIVDALFDALTALDAEQRVVPAAAVAWTADEDRRTWTFLLREGALFHDGSPVTAADFKFAWEQAVMLDRVGHHLRPVEGYDELAAAEADGLAGVSAVGDRVLRVRLRSPYADFPTVVAHPALAPLPRERWRVDPGAFAEQPVGNGPFKLSEAWARGRFLRASRFDAWRNGPRPPIGEVVFRFMDPGTGYLAFQQGRVDFTALPPDALEPAQERYGLSADGYRGPGVLTGGVPTIYFLGFNMAVPPFDEPEVRRAVSRAIDRDAIAADNLAGNLSVARAALPPAVPGARLNTCRACGHDPDAARETFADHDVRQLTLWFNDDGGHEPVMEQIRSDLERAGVRVVLRSAAFPVYQQALESGAAGLFRLGWTLEHPLLDDLLYPLFHSAGAHNYGRYDEPRVDALLDEAAGLPDPGDRLAHHRRVEDIVLRRDQAIVPLVTYHHGVVVSERVGGLVYSPLGLPNLHSARLLD